jgi:hypothetical protein
MKGVESEETQIFEGGCQVMRKRWKPRMPRTVLGETERKKLKGC